MSYLEIENVTKCYEGARAVENVSFTVAEGEFVTLLGPSGSGKSTTLNLIAGLSLPDSGRIRCGDLTYYDDRQKISLPIEARNLGLVFQSYALWPHMTVRENVEFPLRLRKVARKLRHERVEATLQLVEMKALSERYPHELSGGQQQRVALARTLVYEPKILLLDEPLSNLDAKLRERARSWLADIRNDIGITTIYVTHDHGEALSLSDRIVVLNKGQIAQIGTPRELYERPSDPFVAEFIGSVNFIEGIASGGSSDIPVLELAGGQRLAVADAGKISVGRRASAAIRPDKIVIAGLGVEPDGKELNRLKATLLNRSYFGSSWQYNFDIGGSVLKVESSLEFNGNEATLLIPPSQIRTFEVAA
ncbi:ABC transporter ATP-binding protein [Rhizobium sp. Leaf262]|uniref:ABC transporter ATP-binding protein n=1 Tax=Rhizobium sp. Leaf262 TaxID=1736312 RepID=UPI000713C31E|nr:ABC transporter ATP-binding protein [Rhizobium sp. Leaf262]KQO77486.1 hypothetical protein ASF29_05300 [Rhizobium sp. Leaf262]